MKKRHQHSRINLDELKAHMVKKLGPEGSKQYFYYLHGFLSLKVSQPEFNKLCVRILGHENIPLHNHFIRCILRNACRTKAPPSPANHHKGTNDTLKQVVNGNGISSDDYHQKGSHISKIHTSTVSPSFPNGGDMLILPVSPRKARTTGLRERRGGDRRSALGFNGKVGPVPLQTLDASTQVGGCNVVVENGYSKLNTPDKNTVTMRPPVMQHHQELLKPGVNENTAPASVHIKELAEPVTRNDEKRDASAARSGPIRAPMGVPLCSASVGGTRKDVSQGHTLLDPFCDDALLDSCALWKRMEGVAARQGLEGVSIDCANVLNHGLDSYLKGLIKSSIENFGARSGHKLTKDNSPIKDHAHIKLVNGFKLGHQHQLQICEQKTGRLVSLQDFRVAMELNPRQLGEDWSLLLEKICTHSFEE